MLRTILRNVVSVGTTQILVRIMGFCITVILTRMLSVDGYGIYVLVLSIYGLVNGLLDFRLRQAVVRYISIDKADKKSLFEIIKSSFFLEGLLGIGGIIVVILLSRYFAMVIVKDVKAVNLIYLGLAITFFSVIIRNFGAIFQGLSRFFAYNFIQIVSPILLLVLLALFIVLGKFSLEVAIILQVITPLFLIAIGTFFLCKVIKGLGQKSLFLDIGWTKKLLTFSFFPFLTATLATLVYRSDIYFVAFFLDPSRVAQYRIGYSLSKTLALVISPVTFVLYPLIGEEFAKKNYEVLNKLYKNYPVLLAVLLVPVIVVLSVFSPEIISFLYTKRYISSVPVFRIWLFTTLIYQMGGICSLLLLTLKRQQIITYSAGINLSLNVIGNLILIPILGIWGAAIASLVSYTGSFLYLIKKTGDYLKIKAPLLTMAVPILLSSVFLGIFYFYEDVVPRFYFGGGFIIYLLIYILSLRYLGVINDDIIGMFKKMKYEARSKCGKNII